MIDFDSVELPATEAAEFNPGQLEAKFIAPPFSVLDTRQGYWQERRRAWLSMGIKSELGRGADLLALSPAEEARGRWKGNGLVQGGRGGSLAEAWVDEKIAPAVAANVANRQRLEAQNQPGYRYSERGGMSSGEGRALVAGKGNARSGRGVYSVSDGVRSMGVASPLKADRPEDFVQEPATGGTSIFDPVLCELMYRWFAPAGGSVLDPFAGGSVRGIVAARLGHPYDGIDLSAQQVMANQAQREALLQPSDPPPQWLVGDSRQLDDVLGEGEPYDLVFTCPPYYDLEVYSDDPRDLSALGDYGAFLEGFGQVISAAAARLRQDRFMVLVVSEIRDPQGMCRGLVPDTVNLARQAGLNLYNEAILVNSAGSLPLRVTKYMESSRKLGRAHQNVLVFLKGQPPRGWSYDRGAPPSPQLSLDLEPDVPAADDPYALL